jgi:Putative addiction module component
MDLKLLESELLKLSPREKAIITYKLLQSLEDETNEDVDDVWIEEALNRYNQISKRDDLIIDSELVIKEAKIKYK